MILYDMHVHTKGISKCSLLSPEQLCDALKNEGTGGFVLTNHYGKRHCDMDFPLWLEKYRDEFYRVKEIAAKRGLRALFGIEVTLGSQDFLLYGVTPEKAAALGEYRVESTRDGIRIAVKNTAEATQLILKNPELFIDYEIKKGGMDDVFLAATGKRLSGGAES